MKDLLRTSIGLALAFALIALAGVPVCLSSACPMSPAQRAACKAMGGDCCEAKGGQVAPPTIPAPVLSSGQAVVALAIPPAPVAVPFPAGTTLLAVPAVVQGVGLFTLLAVFLI